MVGQENTVVSGNSSIGHRDEDSEGNRAAKTTRTIPARSPTWVAQRAGEGDARAAAQIRGWRYADQRNQRRLDATLEPNAFHIAPPPEENQKSDWADFVQQRFSAQQREQNLANQIAATRIWTIDRRSGDVSYMLNGKVSVIDRGRIVTVLNQEEAAIVFGLEMAVQKYGSRIACTGTDEWKRMVTMTAVRHGIFVQFTDPDMQTPLDRQERIANPLQLQVARLHSIESRLRTEESGDLIFTDEADVRQLLLILQPVAQARQLIELLKVSRLPEPKSNVDGTLTIALLRSPTGEQSLKVSIHEGKRQEIIDLVVEARQMAHRLMRSNLRTHSNEIRLIAPCAPRARASGQRAKGAPEAGHLLHTQSLTRTPAPGQTVCAARRGIRRRGLRHGQGLRFRLP
jgi:hypothetical protein